MCNKICIQYTFHSHVISIGLSLTNSHAFATNGNEVQNYVCFYEAKDVVATGLHDLYKTKKQVSVHGFIAKFQRLLVKLAPHSFVMNVWINQQKKPKNDPRTQKS